MQPYLALMAALQCGAFIATAWLMRRAASFDVEHDKQARRYSWAAIACVAGVLLPAVAAVWSVIGDYPMGACPNCSLVDKTAIVITLFFTVVPVLASAFLVTLVIFSSWTERNPHNEQQRNPASPRP
ncbi:hypothetical protein [Pseudomonas fluorescens]|uniref:Uncharacterized protein n=1 Tax=Pseudomonas fluorescens TaxID=294 RepID=A0A2T0HN03_PSEFL|nr:hypothetical protein [Pseudomonas fluorescens]PRW84456.1 hypothetical protein C7A10_28900 [Pseudomonas fluorescens]